MTQTIAESILVNIHSARKPYSDNIANGTTKQQLATLGVTKVRDDNRLGAQYTAQHGAQVQVIVATDAQAKEMLAQPVLPWRAEAGPNEPDTFAYKNNWPASAVDVRAMIDKIVPILTGKVFMVGIPLANAGANPTYAPPPLQNVSGHQMANVHSYMADRSPALRAQRLANHFASARTQVAPGLPLMVTEYGQWTDPDNVVTQKTGFIETTEAFYAAHIVSDILAFFAAGATEVGIYELEDNPNNPTSIEGHYGLFRADGSIKPAGQALADFLAKYGSYTLDQVPALLDQLTKPFQPATPGALWGCYIAGNDVSKQVTLEASLGRKLDLVKKYVDASASGSGTIDDPNVVSAVKGGRNVHIALEADVWNGSGALVPGVPAITTRASGHPYYPWAQWATGACNAILDRWVASIKNLNTLGSVPFVDFSHEPDTGAGGFGTPDEFTIAFRYVIGYLRRKGCKIISAWVVTGYMGTGHVDYTTFYPGDDVVDYIGYDPYNHPAAGQTWNDFGTMVNAFYQYVVTGKLGNGAAVKPLMLAEYGCEPDARQPAWMSTIIPGLKAHPQIKAVEYFDSGTWAEEESTPGTVAAFAKAGQDPYVNTRVTPAPSPSPTPAAPNPTPWAVPITPDPTDRIKALQMLYGIKVDGLWGNESLTAAEKAQAALQDAQNRLTALQAQNVSLAADLDAVSSKLRS